MSEILTVTEAAEIKGVSRQAIYTAIETGKLKATSTNVAVVGIKRSELDKFQPNERSMKNAGRPRREAR
jgi:excisionase family DNA binding protein